MVEAAKEPSKETKKASKQISYGHLYTESIKEMIEKEEWQKAMRECGTSKLSLIMNASSNLTA
jgi:hypothetical protein